MEFKRLVKFSLLSLVVSQMLCAEESTKLDSVTVTANKVEENIQDVPQSITVISEEILKEKNIDSIPKIIEEIPNMDSYEGSGFGVGVNFRGINTSMFTNNNPVVVYVDGVPVADRYTYKASLVNAKRVEVLRGPQGTLYGKDAMGAVINIVTHDTPDSVSGFIGAEYGSDNFMQTSFNLNAPLINNKLYAGINGEIQKDDGWITNDYYNDDKAAKTENKNYNAYLKYQPNDRLSLKLNIAHNEKEEYGLSGGAVTGLDIDNISRATFEHSSYDMPLIENVEIDSQSIALKYSLNDFDIDWVSTHRDSSIAGDFDADYSDGANNLGYEQWNYTDTEIFTHELRVSNFENDIKWVAGLYMDSEDRTQNPYGMETYYEYTGYGAGKYKALAASTTKNDTYALFGQTMLPLSEQLELTLGGRYQKIEKDFYAHVVNTFLGSTMSDFSVDAEKNWDIFLPKLALAYKKSDNLTSFLSISKGYMPGGYNYFPSSASAEDALFKPEKTVNYEMGVKGGFRDFNFAASIFYMDIEDIHVYQFVNNVVSVDNADQAHSYGLELEGQYFLSDAFDISGSLGLIKAKYDDYDAGDKKLDGKDIENVPSHTLNLTLNYHGDSGLYGYFNIEDQGDVYYFRTSNADFIKSERDPIINIKFGKQFSSWDMYAYVDNLTDEDYVTSYMANSSLAVAVVNEPRFVGIGAKYNF